MKKLLFLTLTLFTLSFVSTAQDAYRSPVQLTNSLDTISNTTPQNASITINDNLDEVKYVAIQGVATKRYGTMGGKMELQGTIDGTNWKRIASDTLAMTTVSTAQSYIWVISTPCYTKYRVLFTGAGTMSASISAWMLKRKKVN